MAKHKPVLLEVAQMKLVFADFDQTISSFDTLLPFAHFSLQQLGRRRRYPIVLFLYVLYRVGFLSDVAFRTRLCRLLVAGRTTRQVSEIAEKFHARHASSIINSAVWNRIVEQAGPSGRVMVLSSNFDFVIEPLRRQKPDLEIHATQAAAQFGTYTGALARYVGSSADKLRLFETIGAAKPGAETIGFGDSQTDHGFLLRCQRAWLVGRPKSSRLGRMRRAIDCCLGRFARMSGPEETEFLPFGS